MFKPPFLLKPAIVLAAVLVAQTASGQNYNYTEKGKIVFGGLEYTVYQHEDPDFILLELINKQYPDFPHLDGEQVDAWWYRFRPEERPRYSPDEEGPISVYPDVVRVVSAVDYNHFVRKFWRCFNTKERHMIEENGLSMWIPNTIDNEGHVIEIPKMSVSPLSVGMAISEKSYSRLTMAVKRYFVYEDGGMMKDLGIDYYPGLSYAGNVLKIKVTGGEAKFFGEYPSVYEIRRDALEALPFEYKHVDIQKILKQRERKKRQKQQN